MVISEFISLDGVVQAPGGSQEDTDGRFEHGGWSMPFFDPETMGGAFDRTVRGADALVFGRRTWTTMASAWPDRAGDPFADLMNGIPKHMASRKLAPADLEWNNSHLLPANDAVAGVRELLTAPGRDLLMMGSPNFAAQLITAGVVDEFVLMIEPVVLGGGKRLFPDDGHLRALDLVDHQVSATGVHICTYRPAANT